MKPFTFSVSGMSDQGLIRPTNQDRWAECGNGAFIVVADGMGGHQAGEVAAELVVEKLKKWFVDSYKPFESKPSLGKALRIINKELFEKSFSNESLRGMGTTVCALLMHQGHAVLCHAGDSRIYRNRKGKFEQLTRDDSLVADLLDLGQLEPHDVADYEYKNVVTRAVAMEPDLVPHLDKKQLQEKDLFLLCTDGLTSMLDDRKIAKILNSSHSLEEKRDQLIQAAKQEGGRDNITVVLVAVESA